MKKIMIMVLAVFLAACSKPATFDATNNNTIKESSQKIVDGLSKKEQDQFGQAITYFAVSGGKAGQHDLLALMQGSKNAKEVKIKAQKLLLENFQTINGLTGKEIISKFEKQVKEQAPLLQAQPAAGSKDHLP